MNQIRLNQPKFGKLIKLKCYDWSDYTCEGMWTAYKGQKGGRFCIKKPDGTFEPDRKTWSDMESWEYVNEATDE